MIESPEADIQNKLKVVYEQTVEIIKNPPADTRTRASRYELAAFQIRGLFNETLKTTGGREKYDELARQSKLSAEIIALGIFCDILEYYRGTVFGIGLDGIEESIKYIVQSNSLFKNDAADNDFEFIPKLTDLLQHFVSMGIDVDADTPLLKPNQITEILNLARRLE